jgi:hypothetical protein
VVVTIAGTLAGALQSTTTTCLKAVEKRSNGNHTEK